MLSYYAVFDRSSKEPPVGLIAKDAATGRALIWNHRKGAWDYQPGLVARFLGTVENEDRYEPIDRETAERIAPEISGGEPLPDEESIRWVFQWEGKPPQNDD